MNQDKAGKTYWDRTWENREVLSAVDPRLPGLNNHINRQFHEYFQNAFSGMTTKGKKILEIGCARSQWLPYFAKEFGFVVSGIDYSEIGCVKAREILSHAGVSGEVMNMDFFNPPAHMLHAYDVVVSFGVVEHFKNTFDCINAYTSYLSPGGLMITVIPNLAGLVGLLQKKLNKSIYDKHEPLDMNMLREAHHAADLTALTCDYFLSTNFGVLNMDGLSRMRTVTRIKMFFCRALSFTSMMVWQIEEVIGSMPSSKMMSPYIICRGKWAK
ncbi:MAG TPA: class I SAM-dependent methyltransferase [Nitrospirota bacterium]|nr:class I SAM-dependent methyltransferase [Nitrospirota bacterium]